MAFVSAVGLSSSLRHSVTPSSFCPSSLRRLSQHLQPRLATRSLHASRPASISMVNPGDSVPTDVELMRLEDGKPTGVKVSDVFPAGKKVAFFTIPGALTPTCQDSHVVDWLAALDDLKAKGVDSVACISVNDPFVMDVFEKKTNSTGKIAFYADGGAQFTKAVGVDVDTGAFGGVRAKRASYIVDDGKFVSVNVEDKGTNYDGPAKPETILGQL